MGKHLTEITKGRILKLALAGKKISQICKEVKKSNSTVRDFINVVRKNGKLMRSVGSGRKPLIPKKEQNLVVSECKKMVKEAQKLS